MKLVTFAINNQLGEQHRLGALLDDHQDGRIVDVTSAYAAFLGTRTDEPTPMEIAMVRTPPDMIGWLRGREKSFEAAEQALRYAREQGDAARGLRGEQLVFQRSDVRLLAPIERPNTFRDFSIYEEHMSRITDTIQPKQTPWFRWPPYYTGNPETFTGPEDPIPYPYYSDRLDLEFEIGIVIGRAGRNLTVEQARECIAGYTILIDPSARDQYLNEREPFAMGKRKSWCTVLGPCLTTADSIDEMNMKVRMTVDGETWYEGSTSAPRSFRAEQLVAYISDNEPVLPGDVMGTGTISFSSSMDLHRWPQVGQRVRWEVEGIGWLEHTIVAGEHVVDHVRNGIDGLLKPPAATA